MTTVGALFINDRDVEADFAFYVSGLAGWPGNLASAPRDVPLSEGPEMQGALLDPRLIRRKPGTATVTGFILTPTAALAQVALDALRGLVYAGGEVEVRTFYSPDRYCKAICTGFDGTAHQPEILDGNVNVALSFAVKNGVAVRSVPDGFALTTGRTSVPIGTAESRPVITVHGGGAALTNPTITIRNAAGDVVQSASFTVALGANDVLRVDCARCTVSKIASGVVTDGLSLWTGGDYGLVLRPYDGWVESGVFPTVELSASGGVAQGLISYSRRWV
jgi:phage-related protein